MFSHVQLNEQGKFLRKVPAGEPIEWDANNYCTAFALEKDGKADQFRVYPLYNAGHPTFDPITQAVREIDPAPVDGLWAERWEVVALDADAIAANQAQANAARKQAILAELAAIDLKSIRALREGYQPKIAELETQAQALRTELAAL